LVDRKIDDLPTRLKPIQI